MIRPLSISELVVRFGGRLVGKDRAFSRVGTDSRALEGVDCFVALKGERFDAHAYLDQVIAAGVSVLILAADKVPEALPDNCSAWLVADTTLALGQVACLAREAFSGPLVAITGSSGKTSVKEMLAAIARACYGEQAVLATSGNLNNHIGVPLTLLALKPGHRFAIIEMGASGLGEIEYLAGLAMPTVSVVNNVMAAHVEGFGSVDGVAETKGAIYSRLVDGGTAVINAGDNYAPLFEKLSAARARLRFGEGAEVNASDIRLAPDSAEFVLNLKAEAQPVSLQVAGAHNINNALCAAACATAAGIDRAAIVEGLENFRTVKGRMNLLSLRPGLTLIDDTYNANPGSMKAAIDALMGFDGERWLVMGDMGELGVEAASLHAEVGQYARSVGVDQLFAIGPLSAAAAQAFGNGKIFSGHDAAIETICQATAGSCGPLTILIKGSRSARMELVVQAIKDHEETR